MLLYHSRMSEHLDCMLETAGTQYALGIWRIYSGTIDFADRLRASWILRIHCFTGDRLRASWILRIHCFTGVCSRIYCGSTVGPAVDKSGGFIACPLYFADPLPAS